MAFLMFQQLFGGLHELVAHVTLKHPGDEVDLQMALKHLEKEMAIRSSILAWKIPWMEEHGRLHSMGSQRVGHD